MDILSNPYVIIFIVLGVIISNIMVLKYTANAKFEVKKKEDEIEKEENKDKEEEHLQSPLSHENVEEHVKKEDKGLPPR